MELAPVSQDSIIYGPSLPNLVQLLLMQGTRAWSDGALAQVTDKSLALSTTEHFQRGRGYYNYGTEQQKIQSTTVSIATWCWEKIN